MKSCPMELRIGLIDLAIASKRGMDLVSTRVPDAMLAKMEAMGGARWIADLGVDAMFSATPLSPEKKRKHEIKTKDLDVEKTAATAMIVAARKRGGGGAPTPLPLGPSPLIQAWFEDYTAKGCAGQVGLVPEPVKGLFPMTPPKQLDKEVEQWVRHFWGYMERQRAARADVP